MPFELYHFNNADRVIHDKKMTKALMETLDYVESVLFRSFYRGSMLRSALEDMGWREGDNLQIIEGRRYRFKGFLSRMAIEANLYVYEYLWEGLFRLQLGFDHGNLDCGVLLLTSQRSGKSPLGSSAQILAQEIDSLFPTISLPVSVALYDLGVPRHSDEDHAQNMESSPATINPETTREVAA